jgi:hypothetical protein
MKCDKPGDKLARTLKHQINSGQKNIKTMVKTSTAYTMNGRKSGFTTTVHGDWRIK